MEVVKALEDMLNVQPKVWRGGEYYTFATEVICSVDHISNRCYIIYFPTTYELYVSRNYSCLLDEDTPIIIKTAQDLHTVDALNTAGCINFINISARLYELTGKKLDIWHEIDIGNGEHICVMDGWRYLVAVDNSYKRITPIIILLMIT